MKSISTLVAKDNTLNRSHWLIFLFGITFISCAPRTHLATVHTGYTSINENDKATNPKIDSILKPYRAELDLTMNEIVGYTGEMLPKSKPESKLTNLLADILATHAAKVSGMKVDLAFINFGGIRLPMLPEGEITKGKIYELSPFDNKVVILQMSGAQLNKLLNAVAASGGWPVSKELRMEIIDRKPASVTIHGTPVSENATYTIALPDYIANGGDGLEFLKSIKQIDTKTYLRDAILEYFIDMKNKNQIIDAQLDGRITKKR
jgi:2',3'-cyclic-nucleotide 2'-phosphodiesterase (5'-nucleotidase family)